MGSVYNYSTSPNGFMTCSADYVKNSGATNWQYGNTNIAVPSSASSRTMYFSFDKSIWSGTSFSVDRLAMGVTYRRANGTSIDTSNFYFSPLSTTRFGISLTIPANCVRVDFTFYPDLPLSPAKTSNYSLVLQISKLRLADQNSYLFLDGNTAGYVWAGTPNASQTLIANVDLQASGAITIDGSLAMTIQPFIALDATIVFGGSLEVYRTGTEAHAEIPIGGSLEMWPYGPVSASAAVPISGSIELAALVPISADATMPMGGGLEMVIALIAETVATITIGGSLDIGLPPEVVASGNIPITGTLEVAIATQMVMIGDIPITGSLEIGQAIPPGAFTDFAVFGVTAVDPMLSIVSASNGGINSGATGADWTRVYAQFTAPVDNPQWRRAAYAVPGIQFGSVPAAAWQEFTNVQVEIADAATPSAFAQAASLRPLIYPDRLNVFAHHIGVIAEPGPWYSGDPIASPITGDTTGALRVPVKFGQNMLFASSLDWLRPGATYTASLYMKPAGLITDVSVNASLTSFEAISSTAKWTDGSDAPELGAGWRRISFTFRAPSDGLAKIFYSPVIVGQTVDEYFDVAGVIVEEGVEVLPYFWPSVGDADTGYRAGYPDATGGIFYYKDKARRAYILKQALADQVPAGIGIGDPEFFVIPHIDA